MALLRTILIFMIIVILGHLGILYAEVDPEQNGVTSGVVSLGELLEVPAQAVIDALPTSPDQEQTIQEQGTYFIGFAAAAGYFILFLLLGVGRH